MRCVIVIFFLLLFINFEARSDNNKFISYAYNECKIKSDDVVELNVDIKKREYSLNYTKLDNIRVIIKDISGEGVFIPSYIGYKYSGFDNSIYLDIYLKNEKGDIVPKKDNHSQSCKECCLITAPLWIDSLTFIPPFHFIGYDYKEENFKIDKTGKYYLYVKLFSNAKEILSKNPKSKRLNNREKNKIERTWQGCIISEPVEIVVY